MENALIVSAGEKSSAVISELLVGAQYDKIVTVRDAAQARQRLEEEEFDLCLIDTPLPGELGLELALDIAERSACDVIWLAAAGKHEDLRSKAEDLGVITLTKPVGRSLFWNTVRVARVVHRRVLRMRRENLKLRAQVEDIKLVNRAKLILISHLKMSEPEAHKYIERQAMDTRASKRTVAEGILKVYEN